MRMNKLIRLAATQMNFTNIMLGKRNQIQESIKCYLQAVQIQAKINRGIKNQDSGYQQVGEWGVDKDRKGWGGQFR